MFYSIPNHAFVVNGTGVCEFFNQPSSFYTNHIFNLHFGFYGIIDVQVSDEVSRVDFNLTTLEIEKLEITKSVIEIHSDLNEIRTEINNLLWYATNAIEIYLFDKPFQIPKIPYIKADNPQLQFNNGYIHVGANITLEI